MAAEESRPSTSLLLRLRTAITAGSPVCWVAQAATSGDSELREAFGALLGDLGPCLA
jgi:hypothetical protein